MQEVIACRHLQHKTTIPGTVWKSTSWSHANFLRQEFSAWTSKAQHGNTWHSVQGQNSWAFWGRNSLGGHKEHNRKISGQVWNGRNHRLSEKEFSEETMNIGRHLAQCGMAEVTGCLRKFSRWMSTTKQEDTWHSVGWQKSQAFWGSSVGGWTLKQNRKIPGRVWKDRFWSHTDLLWNTFSRWTLKPQHEDTWQGTEGEVAHISCRISSLSGH